MNYPKVSIIILNWNGLDETTECIESLKKINYPNYELVVADNGSRGADGIILKEKYGDFIFLIQNVKNYGFAEGNNIAIRQVMTNSTSDYILLLNNDTIVHPAFLTAMVTLAATDKSIGIIGPKTYLYGQYGKLQFTSAKVNLWSGHITNIGFGKVDLGQYENIQDTDYCQGSCFLIRRSVIEKIGLMDNEYFAYFEEIDYCLRAKKTGFSLVYCPCAMIWHKGWSTIWNRDYQQDMREIKVYYSTRNLFLLIKKHSSKLQKGTFFIYYFFFQFWVFLGILLVYRRNIHSLRPFLRGVGAGLCILLSNSK